MTDTTTPPIYLAGFEGNHDAYHLTFHIEVDSIDGPPYRHATMEFVRGDHPVLDAAVDAIAMAAVTSFQARMLSALGDTSPPDTPEDAVSVLVCRICERRGDGDDWTKDARGFAYCPDHAGVAQ